MDTTVGVVLVVLVSTCSSFQTDCPIVCLNGVCAWNGKNYYCQCPLGYYGDQCELGYGGYPDITSVSDQNTDVYTDVVTPKQTTPLIGENPRPDMAMIVLYLVIGVLLISFTALTLRYKRQYKSLRQEQRQSSERASQLEGIRRSYHLRDLAPTEADTCRAPPGGTIVFIAAPIPPPYKDITSGSHGIELKYDEPPPPYEAIAVDGNGTFHVTTNYVSGVGIGDIIGVPV